jgi:hypothetical protein
MSKGVVSLRCTTSNGGCSYFLILLKVHFLFQLASRRRMYKSTSKLLPHLDVFKR